MGENTAIEWADHTFNPSTDCQGLSLDKNASRSRCDYSTRSSRRHEFPRLLRMTDYLRGRVGTNCGELLVFGLGDDGAGSESADIDWWSGERCVVTSPFGKNKMNKNGKIPQIHLTNLIDTSIEKLIVIFTVNITPRQKCWHRGNSLSNGLMCLDLARMWRYGHSETIARGTGFVNLFLIRSVGGTPTAGFLGWRAYPTYVPGPSDALLEVANRADNA